jgi:hypothetical protein
MTEALKRLGCEVTWSDSPSSLEKSSPSFGESASLTRTNSGEDCGLIRGEDGSAIELADERLLEDMAKQVRGRGDTIDTVLAHKCKTSFDSVTHNDDYLITSFLKSWESIDTAHLSVSRGNHPQTSVT